MLAYRPTQQLVRASLAVSRARRDHSRVPPITSRACRLGRRGTIFVTATISALTCIW